MKINHSEYQKKIKKYSAEQLLFVIKDCQEAIEAMPNGGKAGYYLDEISYCAMEMKKRSCTND